MPLRFNCRRLLRYHHLAGTCCCAISASRLHSTLSPVRLVRLFAQTFVRRYNFCDSFSPGPGFPGSSAFHWTQSHLLILAAPAVIGFSLGSTYLTWMIFSLRIRIFILLILMLFMFKSNKMATTKVIYVSGCSEFLALLFWKRSFLCYSANLVLYSKLICC